MARRHRATPKQDATSQAKAAAHRGSGKGHAGARAEPARAEAREAATGMGERGSGQVRSRGPGGGGPARGEENPSRPENGHGGQLFRLVSDYDPAGDQPGAIDRLVVGVKRGDRFHTLLGVTGSGKTFTIANVIAALNRPTLVISHNKTLAAQLYEEFATFFPENAVEYFVSYYDYYQPEAYVPSSDTYIAKEVDINREIEKLRFSTTQSLLTRRDVIVVASVSCIYGLGSPEEYARQNILLAKGDAAGRDELVRRLVSIHYSRNDVELKPGAFRAKGDTIEVWPPGDDEIVRVELWGDEVDGLSLRDPVRGEVTKTLEKTTIFPAKHFVLPEEEMDAALKRILRQLDDRLAELQRQGKLLEAQRLEQRTRFDLEMIRELGYCSGIENYSQPLSGRARGEPPWTLLDYFPDDYLLVIDESHVTVPQVRGMYEGDRARKETLVEFGFRLPSALDNRPLRFHEFEKRFTECLFVSATPGPYEKQRSSAVVEQIIRPTGLIDPEIVIRPSEGQVDDLLEEIRRTTERGERVLVTILTKRMAEDLTEHFKGLGVKVEYLHSDIDTLDRVLVLEGLRRGEFDVLVGINLLREGLDLPEVSLVAILDADKYGFLRSETSLIQTIGRAARNVNGRVLMYASDVTPAMKGAVDTTNERRRRQLAFNEEHGIRPKTIVKGARKGLEIDRREREVLVGVAHRKVQEMEPDELDEAIRELTGMMNEAAKELEFEKAALLRDKLVELKGAKRKLEA